MRKGSHRKKKQCEESVAEILNQNVSMQMNKVHSQIRKDSVLAGIKIREKVRRYLDK